MHVPLPAKKGRNTTATATASIPAPSADPGYIDNAAIPDVPAFVDTIATNQRGDARYATLATNAGVRVVSRFLDIWQPLTEIVDAGVSAPANGSFPAVRVRQRSIVKRDRTDPDSSP